VVHGPARGLVILDAGSEAVAATLDPARQRSEADAALIVDAVNERDKLQMAAYERDRLRAFVRELADCLEEAGGDAFRALIDRAREVAK
jgi:hypothetical protein